jgi:ribonucleoside-diphosphate reductase alpha chain
MQYGPQISACDALHAQKYRLPNESFEEACARQAASMADNEEHRRAFKDILLGQRFMPAGRVQSAMGSPRDVTAYNCFVSGTIEDSIESIMAKATESAETMRRGGGIGFDFSRIRPSGDRIVSLDSAASGPVSFMGIFDAVCATIVSAGHRRGAMMAVLRVDHPDIEEFIRAKRNQGDLTNFNISIGVTDAFMQSVVRDEDFALQFDGQVYRHIKARPLWDEIMRNTWDWAEPGVLFVDRINQENNLWYTETIEATNPCIHPDTLVETIHGRVKIKDITEPTQVYSRQADGTLGVSEATRSWVSQKNAQTLKITTRNGKSIQVTPEHLMHTENGWVDAQDLKVGDRITQLCRARRGRAYSGVKLTTEENRAYKMEHRMIADAVYGVTVEDDVHHIDGDTYNNSIDNLEVLAHAEHSKYTSLFDNPQTHQVRCQLGRFEQTGRTPKTIVPMPEDLRSNNKNNYSNAIISIEEGDVVDVYDLTVHGDHNFIANFMVVHNCGEQPLPPYGACLLGSFNLVKYIDETNLHSTGRRSFDFQQFKEDIPHVVSAMDNVIDRTSYPLVDQEVEAKAKRRMGLGVTGLANTLTLCGHKYGSPEALRLTRKILKTLMCEAYSASADIAVNKGVFPAYDAENYLAGQFISRLPDDLKDKIKQQGIRNSHLTSIAPTGTISFTADNISSGIEPVFQHELDRTVQTEGGTQVVRLKDYVYNTFGIKGDTTDDLTVDDHLNMQIAVQPFVDSAVSKTINVGDDVTFDEFKDVYMKAWKGKLKGITTFRLSGKRYGILNKVEPAEEVTEGQACFIDPDTMERTCE